MVVRKSIEGFTLVELSLSIAFIAVLSIAVTLIINNAITTYARGLTLNQINTVGMDLVDDIRGEVQNSSISSICEGNSDECFLVKKTATLEKESTIMDDVPVFGAFCTGRYSYIWNSGYFYDGWNIAGDNNNNKITLRGYNNNIRLLKIKDKKGIACTSISGENWPAEIDMGEEVNDDDIVELLSNNDLALYDFSAVRSVVNTGSSNSVSFYSMSFILGTIQGGINVMAGGDFCKAPESNDAAENFDYCAINKFNFAAQAIGG